MHKIIKIKINSLLDTLSKTKPTTPFPTSLLLSCLAEVKDDPRVKIIAKKGIGLLLKEKSKRWSWNYWLRNSAENRDHPCPDDLDDTFCTLTALTLHRPKLITPKAFVDITRLLTSTETSVGGPYNTWIIDDKKNKDWQDIDVVVNSNIAYFLKLHDIRLPPLEKFIEKKIKDGKYKSKYYSPLVAMYFMSKSYDGPLKSKLIRDIFDKRDSKKIWEDPLHTALAISALINLGVPKERYETAIDYLLKQSRYDPIPFYIESINQKKSNFYSSSELTASFTLEALCKLQKIFDKRESGRESDKIHEQVLTEVKNISKIFPKEIAGKINTLIDKISLDREITLLPYYFSKSLEKSVDEKFLINLGTANLYGWIAYKIYDDIMDNEGDPGLLPTANLCNRRIIMIYDEIFIGKHKSIYTKIMDDMDISNSWERLNTYKKILKYKNLDFLALKSLPHCLTAIAILIKTQDTKDIESTIKFFKHYLISRQMNDDAHDWFLDLERGFINPCASMVLDELDSKKFDIKRNAEKLREIFWQKSIVKIVNVININLKKATAEISRINSVKDRSYLTSLLEPIKYATEKAMSERQKTTLFLKEF